jgi:outer membrane lipoprotein-sorting protein
MKRFIFLIVALATPAWADPTGPEVLAKVDQALTCFKDGVFVSKLKFDTREFNFTTYQKSSNDRGKDKRLVRFDSPGDVKGMGVLIEDASTMYVYLPGFQRVRRMGTHIKNQTFMGSDFGFDSMSTVSFGVIYDAKAVGSDAGNWIIELTQKSGQDLEFPKIKLWADKNMFQPTKMEYYDGAGKKLKTEERMDYKKDSPEHWQPFRIVITDHRRNDHKSEILFSSTKIDSGLKDDLFSVRSLVRGN